MQSVYDFVCMFPATLKITLTSKENFILIFWKKNITVPGTVLVSSSTFLKSEDIDVESPVPYYSDYKHKVDKNHLPLSCGEGVPY